MKSYISINGKRVCLTNEQVEKIKQLLDVPRRRLADIPVGEVFAIGSHEFVVLEQSGDTTAVIRKDLLDEDVSFGDTNIFNDSKVDALCKDFAKELASVIGTDNLVSHTVDLTSDDGLKDYGKIMRQVSLLTADLYRRYVEVLDKNMPDDWWWLATPHSTKAHGNSSWVRCVAPSGFIFNFDFCSSDVGVRPFCILKSHIFVSN